MKISEVIRKYATEQGLAAEEPLKHGMEEQSKESVKNEAQVYSKA